VAHCLEVKTGVIPDVTADTIGVIVTITGSSPTDSNTGNNTTRVVFDLWTTEGVFTDGFESGSLSAWTVSIP